MIEIELPSLLVAAVVPWLVELVVRSTERLEKWAVVLIVLPATTAALLSLGHLADFWQASPLGGVLIAGLALFLQQVQKHLRERVTEPEIPVASSSKSVRRAQAHVRVAAIQGRHLRK